MREVSHMEALETMAMFHNISPGQLRLVLDEFDNGRGSIVINAIINQRYALDKANGKL